MKQMPVTSLPAFVVIGCGRESFCALEAPLEAIAALILLLLGFGFAGAVECVLGHIIA